jgi:choline-sulfatase
MRVPFVVNGPSIPAGRRIDRRIYLQSVMPTSLELAGAERPEHVEFESLLPLLTDETSHSIPVTASPPIYGAYTDTQRMLVQGRHKLILYPKIRRSLLFDLLNDPEEMHDLSETAEAPEIKQSLFAEFLKQQRRIGDSLDVSSAFPQLLKDQALPSATLPLPDE